ncbi:13c16f75-6ad8-4f69-b7b3-bd37e88f1a4d [Thermothielavioides terrestris]|uniref:Hsp90 chaperone protein kinase-targeting subunit n=2 Tax=Thermothielavioides terrestris TaxID=2587410 RepID=G2QT31_THETT|nr:uncharacterized protein THITE_162931 [Thermothielavioides terrestris NRRL 8126]AEO63556.1 hypothetical protein THITE_162931 [Thermothielavioides terrestris NRRL 8126]SPQ20955.1 13c16f75-6ad8-4f69-b7b3-bd37e88f1a4d [Thermothielavioides terrestris]
MVINYSKWDALELSDDSDIEVHPNVDKRSFIRAKQHQIHLERQQRKAQISALRHERIINDGLLQRLHTLISTLQSQQDASTEASPADVAFRLIMESASSKPDEDSPPPRPEGVFHEDSPPQPTYSKMMVTVLDEVNKELDGRQLQKEQRYESFLQELDRHVRKIQDLQADLGKRLDALEQQESKKITSESYHVGFDSSHVSRAKQPETSKEAPSVELLNPNYKLAEPSLDSSDQIPESDYRASHDYIVAHPEIVQNEAETDALLIAAYNAVLDDNDKRRARRYVHQALLLQYCRMLGRDGVAAFFQRIAAPGHNAGQVFETDVNERFQKICEMGRRDAKQRLQGGEVPAAESEDEEEKRARAVFETFAPEMRAALESGSLDQVNQVLASMSVSEAEKMVDLLNQAGCLSIENDIVDATTEEGKQFLRDMEKAALADLEPRGSEETAPTETVPDP